MHRSEFPTFPFWSVASSRTVLALDVAGAGQLELAGCLQDTIPFAEVAPPDVLVCDLLNVSRGKPALFAVSQADAFIPA